MATYQGYTESVELLFEMGGSIEVHGKHGMTALLWASQQGTVVGCCSLWLVVFVTLPSVVDLFHH